MFDLLPFSQDAVVIAAQLVLCIKPAAMLYFTAGLLSAVWHKGMPAVYFALGLLIQFGLH